VFVCEYDPVFAFGVMLFGLPGEERDCDQYVESIPKLDKRVGRRDASLLVEFVEGYTPPNALWRKRFIEARSHLVSRPRVALVLPSAAARATLKLANWVSPAPFEQRPFSTADEAIVWLAERAGSRKPLDALYQSARAKLQG
jgi:hypothetical protein